MYIKCVQRYCSAGLVTIPRDLEEEEENQSTDTISHLLPSAEDALKVCDALYCQSIASHLEHLICLSKRCAPIVSYMSGDTHQLDRLSSLAVMHHLYPLGSTGDRLRLLQFSLLSLCGTESCSEFTGADFLQCVARECNGRHMEKKSLQTKKHETQETHDTMGQSDDSILKQQTDSSQSEPGLIKSNWKRSQSDPDLENSQLEPSLEKIQSESSSEKSQSEPSLMRKRRVNAISAQCIMSQCGRKGGVQRKLCIMRFCHG